MIVTYIPRGLICEGESLVYLPISSQTTISTEYNDVYQYEP